MLKAYQDDTTVVKSYQDNKHKELTKRYLCVNLFIVVLGLHCIKITFLERLGDSDGTKN